jgi:hypothetical protein
MICVIPLEFSLPISGLESARCWKRASRRSSLPDLVHQETRRLDWLTRRADCEVIGEELCRTLNHHYNFDRRRLGFEPLVT